MADGIGETRFASRRLETIRYAAAGPTAGARQVVEEAPVAVVHNAATTAVMLATPIDLEDFAVGFTLTEGLAASLADITGVEAAETSLGFEARVWLSPGQAAVHAARRRQLAGPTGCGLCGIESLEAAAPAPRPVGAGLRIPAVEIHAALEALAAAQALGAATRAAHAAGWWRPGEGLVAAREDVGRHNALDKLAGALARHEQLAAPGVVVLTSRVSVEMVQKAAAIGAQALVAVSAPTTLAVQAAARCGLTLCAVARADGFEVFTHPERIV